MYCISHHTYFVCFLHCITTETASRLMYSRGNSTQFVVVRYCARAASSDILIEDHDKFMLYTDA